MLDAKKYATTAAEYLNKGCEVYDHYKDTVKSIVLKDETFTYYFDRKHGGSGQSTIRYDSCIYNATSWLRKWQVSPNGIPTPIEKIVVKDK